MSEGLAKLWRQHMRHGNFESAWHISDKLVHKRHRSGHACICQETNWNGESLDGKRVLVRCRYGLGDTLQFIRYIPVLRRSARRVILHAQAAVAQVLEHVDGIDALITRYNTIPSDSYDVAVGLTELPHIFRTTIETIPKRVPYIQIAPRLFPPTSDVRVGLVWQGSDWDQRRSVPVEMFADLERIAGVKLHILQRGRALLKRPIDFGVDSGDDDVYEAARTIAGLDLMITIDSMPSHLAAAMATPTWTLLHSDCDWRWMQHRSDSPWYPTMRLFRQKQAGDWRPVIGRVKDELHRLARSRSGALSAAA